MADAALAGRSENLAPNPVYTRLQNSFADQQASLSRLQTQAAQQETQLLKLEQEPCRRRWCRRVGRP